MESKSSDSTNSNCSSSFDSVIPWNDSEKIECWRYIIQVNDYNIPNIVTTIFSSNESMILGAFDLFFEPQNQNISFDISAQRMDLGMTIIDKFTKQIEYVDGITICLPTAVLIEKNVKYNIRLNFSSDHSNQMKNSYITEDEVNLSNGAIIIFHRDESLNFENVYNGVISCLHFNSIFSLKNQ